MFSRVNSNYVGWLSQNNAKRTKVFCDTWPCGQRLITKSVGSEQFEDITGAYKYELGMMKTIFNGLEEILQANNIKLSK